MSPKSTKNTIRDELEAQNCKNKNNDVYAVIHLTRARCGKNDREQGIKK